MTNEGMTIMPKATEPPAGTWKTAGDLPTPAAWHGQHDGPVLLADGTVLVAGGADAAGGSLADAALFGKKQGTDHDTWDRADPMGTPRRLHSLTRLADGRVLAVGGLNGSTEQGSAELYNPATGHWTPTGGLITPRWGHSATLLDDGSVLIAGGSASRPSGGTVALRSAERFDPGKEKWRSAGSMSDARTAHTAVPLHGGMVLVAGGTAPVGAPDDPALAFCELYDQARDKWTATGSLISVRRHHRAVRLSDTSVLITGGTAPGSPGTAPYDPFSRRTAEVFDLDTGKWAEVTAMPSGRALHRAVLLPGGQVMVAGGASGDRDESGFRSVLAYDVTGDAWVSVPGLVTGRWSFAAVVLADDRVLVAGGVARSGLAAADPAAVELTATSEVFGETS
ncbi:Kelch repeat-containing protein [Nonomuraea sp. CA-143628]|uniref:Kelch repeat-containing protein n=1 Tax=Nonomuraea sp. CA-143628 TaxID=3239997 RepID=UPI003D91BCD6